METLSVQEAKEQLIRLIKEASEERRHFRVTSQEGNIVIIPEETYDNLLVTLEVLSTPGLMSLMDDEEEAVMEEVVGEVKGLAFQVQS